jgi:hypothetical protein
MNFFAVAEKHRNVFKENCLAGTSTICLCITSKYPEFLFTISRKVSSRILWAGHVTRIGR